MADTKTIESQQQWVKDLERLEQANRKVVIPAILKIEQVDRNIQSLYKRRTVFGWSSKKSFFLFGYDENSHECFLKNVGKRINEIRDAIQVCNVESHLFCFQNTRRYVVTTLKVATFHAFFCPFRRASYVFIMYRFDFALPMYRILS